VGASGARGWHRLLPASSPRGPRLARAQIHSEYGDYRIGPVLRLPTLCAQQDQKPHKFFSAIRKANSLKTHMKIAPEWNFYPASGFTSKGGNAASPA
jgi:hypothetical protein